MLKPGFRECAVSDLNPHLQSMLTPPLDGIAQPILCYEKFWDGDLSAYILTAHSAIRASYFIDERGEHRSLDLLPYEDIAAIQEKRTEPVILDQEYALDVIGKDQQKQLRFHFIKQDEFYWKFLGELRQKINQKG